MISWELQKKQQILKQVVHQPEELKEGWVRVSVAGCGLCHTDLGFIYSDVQTRHPLPLVLGHEISGKVMEGKLKGNQVLIPAVIPCGYCPRCKAGNPRICNKQIMPGNDIHGGFSEFIDVPEDSLISIPKHVGQEELARMSVIADAVTTPLQAIHNLCVKKGEVAIIIGCGGVGSFAALLANAYGAHVIAIDIDGRKLQKLKEADIKSVINVQDKDFREIKKSIKDLCKAESLPDFGHKIFETSGTGKGQELAFGLINYGAQVAIIGFTLEKLQVRLSNLMAFDAKLIGNWGSDTKKYPEAIKLVLDGSLNLESFTKLYPLSEINQLIELVYSKGLDHRAILVP